MQKLAKALVAFQAECPVIAKDSFNPFFKSKYASLDSIRNAIQPLLEKHGLAVMQFPISGDFTLGVVKGMDNKKREPFETAELFGTVGVVTRVIHESGEFIEYPFLVPLAKNDPQGAGAAVSYARRYGISGALGLVTDDDDDANAASGIRRRKPDALDKVSIEKIRFAATERLKELSVEPTTSEIGSMVGGIIKAAGYTSAADTPQSEFPEIFEKVQRWEP